MDEKKGKRTVKEAREESETKRGKKRGRKGKRIVKEAREEE